MHKIEAVILYCSNDSKFIGTCITNLLQIGIKCRVVTYSHLYAGSKEDLNIIENTLKPFRENKNFVHHHLIWEPGRSSLYWEAYGRYFATMLVGQDSEYILYIDPDEIIEPDSFLKWLNTNVYRQYTGIKLRQYIYFISPNYRMHVKAYNTVMAKTQYAQSLPFQVDARLQYFNNKDKISRWLAKLGLNRYFYIYKGKPFIHHYTGARTKEEMLIKVANWSHNSDRNDWQQVVEDTYKIKDNKISGLKFTVVDDLFNINKT